MTQWRFPVGTPIGGWPAAFATKLWLGFGRWRSECRIVARPTSSIGQYRVSGIDSPQALFGFSFSGSLGKLVGMMHLHETAVRGLDLCGACVFRDPQSFVMRLRACAEDGFFGGKQGEADFSASRRLAQLPMVGRPSGRCPHP